MGIISKVWLSFYHLINDIHNTHIKFDNNRSSSFGDYLSNKNRHRGWTDRQTEMRKLFFRTLEVITHQENIKVASRLTDSATILPWLIFGMYSGSNNANNLSLLVQNYERIIVDLSNFNFGQHNCHPITDIFQFFVANLTYALSVWRLGP